MNLSNVILVSWSMRYPGGRVSLSSHNLLIICLTCRLMGKKLDMVAITLLLDTC